LEVISPGVLPGDLTINDIGKGVSEIRNRLIVKIFREYRYIEQLGSGINRIIDTAKQTDQPIPVFEEVGNFFKATLYNCPAVIGVRVKLRLN
jgi:ATP-dependent DNA helicase RecG